MRLFCCCGLIPFSFVETKNYLRRSGSIEPAAISDGVQRLVARSPAQSRLRVNTLAGRSPREALGVTSSTRQLVSTGTESKTALPASSHPVAGN